MELSDSDSNLPDLDEDDGMTETHPRSLQPMISLKRKDFYSDSSDVEGGLEVPAVTHKSSTYTESKDRFEHEESHEQLPETKSARPNSFTNILFRSKSKILPESSLEKCLSGYSSWSSEELVPLECKETANVFSCNVNVQGKKAVIREPADDDSNACGDLKLCKQIEKRNKLQEKEQKKLEREKQKQLQENMKKQAEFEKSKKRIIQETLKKSKPGECLKHLTVIIDMCLLTSSCGPTIVKCLQTADVRYEVDKQPQTNMISFWREVTLVTESAPNRLETKQKEVIEDEVLIFVPLHQFIEMVESSNKAQQGIPESDINPLDSFVASSKSSLENRNVTLLVQGLENYFRHSNLSEKRSFKSRVQEISGDATKRKNKRKATETTDSVVTRVIVEEAALAAQLRFGTCIKFLESDEEVAKTVLHYAKSVAEKPYKQELSNRLNTGYNGIFVESCRSGTRVGSDGQGLAQIWCQQLQHFKNVSAEVANAIAARYPSPRMLIEAYQSCGSEKEAENLLEDIVVRRGAGIVSTTRRVGKELSRRIYILLTSDDGSQLIN